MSYHRKRAIAFEDIEDEVIITRGWNGLMPNRTHIYCLKHDIDEELGTPIRDHMKIKFPNDKSRATDGPVGLTLVQGAVYKLWGFVKFGRGQKGNILDRRRERWCIGDTRFGGSGNVVVTHCKTHRRTAWLCSVKGDCSELKIPDPQGLGGAMDFEELFNDEDEVSTAKSIDLDDEASYFDGEELDSVQCSGERVRTNVDVDGADCTDKGGEDPSGKGVPAFKSADEFVGRESLTEEEAYEAYKEFAWSRGFGVCKGDVPRVEGVLVMRDFFCHKEGTHHEEHYDRP
ncbi:hypothetical protein PIB30_028056 [Stylosanthes scabra]|uniref:FAR1 domain-containing protein n=1 Tax=Stylosanthes scabra TaxID=79078 RepID=A0ABU6RB70_9FABA|nr:hypothetical protein [Stylosanthes scabra]